MSIYGAMTSGVSGLAANSQNLGMIADNISNVNTIGYKGSRARFSTLVTQSSTNSGYTPGGVAALPLRLIDQQGLLQGSSSPTDLAIDGSGFFVVNEGPNGGTGNEFLFSREGSFTVDSDGNFVNAGGFYLQGWPLDANEALPSNTSSISALETVNVAGLSTLAERTTEIQIGANLPATATVGQTETTNVTIYDSLGVPHDVELTWHYNGTNQWEARVTGMTRTSDGVASATYDSDTTDATPAAALSDTNYMVIGTLDFATNGTPTGGTGPVSMTLNFNPGGTQAFNFTGSGGELGDVASNQMSLALGTYGAASGMTFLDGPYTPKTLEQNGLPFGTYSGVSIDKDGIVTAFFDNGSRKKIYKLPLATFNNPNGLQSRTGNAYAQTADSGEYLLLQANTAGAGKISSASLEASNVDLAEEFTSMIITQRAYSANARIITTSDEMLDELIRLKR
ncbi:MAG: flagellar hook protein FlgE [Alphaproteobacteria bacterium]